MPSNLYNPAGQSQLHFRVEDFYCFAMDIFDALMKSEARTPDLGEDEPEDQRLKPLNLQDEDNWLVGLAKSWAMVADVLTFYQERILNEGYLLTAQQFSSLHELARTVDYRPRPGVGASLWAAFQVSDVEGLPHQVQVPQGLGIESRPPDADETLVFETSQALDAKAEWNLLAARALPETAPPKVLTSAVELELSGASTGLMPGDGVLVTGMVGHEERLFFRCLDQVEVKTDTENPSPAEVDGFADAGLWDDAPYTAIRWSDPLDPTLPRAKELENVQVFALRQQTGLFGNLAPPWSEQAVEVKRQYRLIRGGIRVLSPQGGWRSINEGLEDTPIHCLLFDAEGNLFGGTAEGVFRRLAAARSWESSSRGLPQAEILSLAEDPRGALLAGTSDGNIYRSSDLGEVWTLLTGRVLRAVSGWTLPHRRTRRLTRLPETAVRAVKPISRGKYYPLFAGTDTGVFRSTDLGLSWFPSNGGMPDTDPKSGETDLVIEALVSDHQERVLYAATTVGVFKTTDLGRRWEAANRGLPGLHPLSGLTSSPVRALVAFRDRRRRSDYLFAGTVKGVYRSTDGGAKWEPTGVIGGEGTDTGTASEEVTTLAIVDDPVTVTTRLYAGSVRGLWSSADDGASWQAVQGEVQGETLAPVITLAGVPRSSKLAVAMPFGGFAEEQWPGFCITRGRIDLDTVVSGVATGSWVVLQQMDETDGDTPPQAPFRSPETGPPGIYRVEDVSQVYRQDFTIEATVTRIQVEPDPALRRFDLRRTRVWLQSEPLPLRARRLPMDRDKAIGNLRDVLLQMPPERQLIVTGKPAATELPSGELPSGEVPPDEVPPDEPIVSLTTAGELLRELDEWLDDTRRQQPSSDFTLTCLGPAESADAMHSSQEIEMDWKSLRVHGNVVVATEGATIYEEVLGDGNAAQALQRFPLAFPPAYLRGKLTPWSTLHVRVEGQPWEAVPHLYGQPSDSWVYEVALDNRGNATVIFGDGAYGSCLPTGDDNVVATYRTGMSDVEIPPHSVDLVSPPLGLSGVDNPGRGTRGAPPESEARIRSQAPRGVLSFGRIVSTSDYEDFAKNYPDVAKANSTALNAQGRDFIQLTVATYSGQDHRPAEGSSFLDDLRKAVLESRCDTEPVFVDAFCDAWFDIRARVRIAAGYHWKLVEPRIREQVEEQFGFEQSRFQGCIRLSEVIRVLQSVEGVLAINVERFMRSYDKARSDDETLAKVKREIRARPAKYAAGRRRPAELLVLSRLELYEREDPT